MTRFGLSRRTAARRFDKGRNQRHLKLEPLEARRLLAAYMVTNLTDGPVAMAGELPGSLRQAIFDANANPGADTIEFQSELSGSVRLNSGELTITDDVTINGLGSMETIIDARANSRVLNIDDGNENNFLDVEISALMIARGSVDEHLASGGGILSRENLTITDSLIMNNSSSLNGPGGGIFAAGPLTITGSTIRGNTTPGSHAGGIWAQGELTISDSVVTHNSAAADGGGIYARGDLTVTGSTISYNSTGGQGLGGGIRFASVGIGFASGAQATITGSTISGNSAGWNGGGGVFAGGEFTVTDSTISGNSATRQWTAACIRGVCHDDNHRQHDLKQTRPSFLVVECQDRRPDDNQQQHHLRTTRPARSGGGISVYVANPVRQHNDRLPAAQSQTIRRAPTAAGFGTAPVAIAEQ